MYIIGYYLSKFYLLLIKPISGVRVCYQSLSIDTAAVERVSQCVPLNLIN